MSALGELEVTAFVCDSAQVHDDKLYVLGGGWSYLWLAEEQAPANMSLAVSLSIPWSLANQRLDVYIRLVTEDGETAQQEFGPIEATASVEAGRPPGARKGAPFILPFVLNYVALRLDFGGYVWEISVDGTLLKRVPFQVAPQPG